MFYTLVYNNSNSIEPIGRKERKTQTLPSRIFLPIKNIVCANSRLPSTPKYTRLKKPDIKGTSFKSL